MIRYSINPNEFKVKGKLKIGLRNKDIQKHHSY